MQKTTTPQEITRTSRWRRWPVFVLVNSQGEQGFLINEQCSQGLRDPDHASLRTVIVASVDHYFCGSTPEQCADYERRSYPSVEAMLAAGWRELTPNKGDKP